MDGAERKAGRGRGAEAPPGRDLISGLWPLWKARPRLGGGGGVWKGLRLKGWAQGAWHTHCRTQGLREGSSDRSQDCWTLPRCL